MEEEDLDKDKDENLFVQHKTKGVVSKNYLLLDNQSTVDQIANPDLLTKLESPRSQSWCIAIHGKQRQTLKVS
jgi:hypothetical protein